MSYTPSSADYGRPTCPVCGRDAVIGGLWMSAEQSAAIKRPAWCSEGGCGWEGAEQDVIWLHGVRWMPKPRRG